MGLILISCSLKPINTSDWTRSEWFYLLASVWMLHLLIIPSHDGLVTYLPTHEEVTMTSALHGWQAVLARFEQSRKRQRAEHHEERASSLRLAVANHKFECKFQNCAKTKGEKFYFINALWSVKKRAPACSESSLFCLLSAESWVYYEIQT